MSIVWYFVALVVLIALSAFPFIIYDKDHEWHIKDGHFGLANVAPTVVKMMGLTAPDCWEESMV